MELKYRTRTFNRDAIDVDARSVNLAFSSEEPVERSGSKEILGHGINEINLEFLRSGTAPLLLDHDHKKQIGVVEDVRVEGTVGRATVRFGKSSLAAEIFDDVTDGIRKNISVGYLVKDVDRDTDNNSFRAINWTPKEISIVSIPADSTVGVGRSEEQIIKTEDKTSSDKGYRNDETSAKEAVNKKTDNNNLKRNITVMENETQDFEQIKRDAVKGEQTRVADILALGERYDVISDARAWIESGKDASGFTQIVLEKVAERNVAFKTEADVTVDFTEKEQKTYSLSRALLATATGRYDNAGLEMEASRALEKKLNRSTGGLLVPMNVLSERAMTTTGVGSGAELVGTTHLGGEFISPIHNASVVKDLGARVMSNLTGKMSIPTGGSAIGYWVGQEQAITESTLATGNIPFAANTVGALVTHSRETLLQSDPSIDEMIRGELVKTLTEQIDKAALAGIGSATSPTGVLYANNTNLKSLGTNGANMLWADVVSSITDLYITNAKGLDWVIPPDLLSYFQSNPKLVGTDSNMIMNDTKTLNGYNVTVSNHMPINLTKGTGTNLASAIFGTFSNMILGEWGILELDSTNSDGDNFKNKNISISAVADVDIVLTRPEAFTVIKDIIV